MLTFVTACETEELVLRETARVPPAFKMKYVPIAKLLVQPTLNAKLTALSHTSLAKSTNLAGIQIDTTGILALETDRYISYTFNIVQDSIEKQTVLKNYMLTIVNDTTEIQHLVTYNVLSPGVYDMDNIQATRVYGNDLRVQFSKCGNSFDWYSYEVCTAVTCDGNINGVPQNHGPGEPCIDGQQRGRWDCVTTWLPVMISDGGCNGGGIGGDPGIGDNNPPGLGNGTAGGDGTGGSTGGNRGNEDENDVLDIGMNPNDGLDPIVTDPNKEDCTSLGAFMTSNDIGRGSTSNENYIYNDLRMHAINNNFEKGQLITESIANGMPSRGYTELIGNAFSSEIYINPNFPADGSVIGLIHTHWEKLGSGSTLSSMFSMQDFLTFCTMVARRHRSGKDINPILCV